MPSLDERYQPRQLTSPKRERPNNRNALSKPSHSAPPEREIVENGSQIPRKRPKHQALHERIRHNQVIAVRNVRVGCGIKCPRMTSLHSLQQLTRQFEELASNLDVSRDPDHRRELLKRMKLLIEETDKLISAEVLQLNSIRDRTNEA